MARTWRPWPIGSAWVIGSSAACFTSHLGASPIAVAQTRRVLLAKQLIHESRLSMAEIALAAGFGSIRRFNETFQQLFGRPPKSLRRDGARRRLDGAQGRGGDPASLSPARTTGRG